MRPDPRFLSRREFFLLAGTTSAVRAAENDFWNSKPPSQWTVGDIYRLMNHSPWAKRVQAWRPDITNSQLKDRVGVFPPTGYVFGPTGVVTWESAPPIRDAFKSPLPPEFEDSYVIGVDSFPLQDTPNLDYLSGATRLRYSGQPKWTAPVSAMQEVIRNSTVYLFGFSHRAAPVGRHGGEVIFETQMGEWVIQARFSPKEMLYRKQLAL